MKKQLTSGEMLRADLKKNGWNGRRFAQELEIGEATLSRILGDKEPMSIERAIYFFIQCEKRLGRQMEEYLNAWAREIMKKIRENEK